MAIEPKSKADREKLSLALSALSEEDPTFRVSTNEETGQTIIAGMGELHLEILRDRMFREFSVEANVGKPEVAYKETITVPAKTKPSTSSNRVDADNMLTSSLKSSRMKKAKATRSSARSSAASFQKNTSLRRSKGSKKDLTTGVLAGYSLVDVKVAIVYGSYHEVDSSEMAFKICGSMASKKPRANASRSS